MADFMIGLDQGSSSSKALLVNRRGKVVHSATVSYPSVHTGESRVEIDPLKIIKSQLKALRDVLSRLNRKKDRVLGLGIANQRSTIILWDRKTGRPFGPALSWQDRRAAGFVEKWAARNGLIRRRTGLLLTPYYSAPKIRWLLDQSRKLRDLARQGRIACGTVNTYLVWHLTGGTVHATEPTNAARMLLMNLTRFEWDPELLRFFRIPASMLPEIRSSCGDFGVCRIGGWRIPIRATIGDQQSGLLGLGAVRPGDAVLNYGTGGFLVVNTGGRRAGVPGILDSVAWSQGEKRCYIAEGTVNSVGSVFDWLVRAGLVGSKHDIGKTLRSRGRTPVFIPALAGLGAPHWEPEMKTAVLGLEAGMTAPDLVRGAVEGIGFLFRDIIEAMEDSGRVRAGRIRAGGGGSDIPGLLQIQADIIGKPIWHAGHSGASAEASGLGAAVLAGVGAGWWRLPGRLPALSGGRVFRPRTSRAEQKRMALRWRQGLEALRTFR
ncbi:MAG TPA: FGGY family carbohydrate kinase [Nitrospiria bacterium]